MQKNQLIKKNNEIIRILAMDGEDVLYIPCRIKNGSMPLWADISDFEGCEECSEEELSVQLRVNLVPEDDLSARDKKIARERYSIIAPILTFIEDDRMRAEMINKTSSEKGISKQTVRNYLKSYLIWDSISALVRKQRVSKEKPMSDDEKNIRYAINKYVYSRKKHSLHTAYKLMLKEKYTDAEGNLPDEGCYPTFNQFRYWYSKNKKLLTYYISREGQSGFMRNHRVLIGDNVQAIASAPGLGMADSTIVDIYIVDDTRTKVVGRPVLTAIIDAYSYLCLGYSLGWEGGEYSLQSLMANVVTAKRGYCHDFGIEISEDEWPSALPGCIYTDKGSDYAGETYSQLTDLNVEIVNLEAFRPDEKGVIEKFFDIVQGYFKDLLKHAGVVAPEYYERGSYFSKFKEKSCLTLREFETVLLRSIIHYNSSHIVKNYPFTDEMLKMGIKPYSNCIWKYGIENLRGCNVYTDVTKEQIVLTLLPRTVGRFTRKGLVVNKMRYFADGFYEKCLQGGEAVIAYDKNDVSFVWLYEDGEYTKFTLIESRYQGKDLEDVQSMKEKQKQLVEKEEHSSLQSEVNLIRHIQTIRENAKTKVQPDVKNIRETRKEEREKKHINLVKEAGLYDG